MNDLYRVPSEDEMSDWNSAWEYAISGKKPDVKHMAGCLFGENDGPDWIWIIRTTDDKWGYVKAGCDYTGWDCQSSGTFELGFETAQAAINAIPMGFDFNEAKKALLEQQVRGEKPYGLT